MTLNLNVLTVPLALWDENDALLHSSLKVTYIYIR